MAVAAAQEEVMGERLSDLETLELMSNGQAVYTENPEYQRLVTRLREATPGQMDGNCLVA